MVLDKEGVEDSNKPGAEPDNNIVEHRKKDQ